MWQRLSVSVASLPDLVMTGAPTGELHQAEGLRYLLRYLLADSIPEVSLRTVAFESLAHEMATSVLAGAATIDPASRAEQIRTRRLGLAQLDTHVHPGPSHRRSRCAVG